MRALLAKLVSVALLGIGVGVASAQPAEVPPPPPAEQIPPSPPLPPPWSLLPQPQPVWDAPPTCRVETIDCSGPQFWVGADFLLWWVKDAPIPVPLVTTGDPNNPNSGTLGFPDTRVLYGAHDQGFGVNAGLRLNIGGWLDEAREWGVQASAFFLQQQSARFSGRSDSTGNPAFSVPFYDVANGGENSFIVSDPLTPDIGTIVVRNRTQLWGTEVDGLVCLLRVPSWEINGVLGFRYLGLREQLTLTRDLSVPSAGVVDNQRFDSFRTHNDFYGGQLGLQGSWRYRRFSVDLAGHVALGSMEEYVNISGSNTIATTTGTTVFPGGIFTQPTNIGCQHQSRFAVVPDVQLKVGYALTQHLRATVGYDFLYVSSVVRPGDQIDRVVNTTQLGGAALGGVARPMPLFNTTDFYAHGLNLGLEYRY